MKPLRFRVYDNKRKEWVHGPGNEPNLFGEIILMGNFLCRPDDTHVRIEELNDLTALQFTCVKDKNGVDIYENDLILVNGVHRMKIVFDSGAFVAEEIKPFFSTKFGDRPLNQFTRLPGKKMELLNVEVMGNVYDYREAVKS
jgi:uncharacterized phage protein (TIGR01671 family)